MWLTLKYSDITTEAEEQIAPDLPAGSYVDGATTFYRTELIWGLEAKYPLIINQN